VQGCDADQEVWQRDNNALSGLLAFDSSSKLCDFKCHRVDRDCLTQFLDEHTPPLAMTGLTRKDVTLGRGAHVRVIGKGRKERCVPLAKPTVAVLKAWLREPPRGDGQFLFPNARGTRLTPDGVHYLLVRHVRAAIKVCPSLKGKRVTVHVLRHTMALDLLQGGVDRSVIALWLGHESLDTTQIYLEATLAMKEKALSKTKSLNGKFKRYRPGDQLLGFLNDL
jgi:Phage integrase family